MPPRSESTSAKGRRMEDLAAQALETHGYTILARNWRSEAGEIDIVAQEGDVLAFVEVKARTGEGFGAPEEAITPAKRERLINAGLLYAAEHAPHDAALRFDVVAIELSLGGRVERLTLYRSAIQAGG